MSEDIPSSDGDGVRGSISSVESRGPIDSLGQELDGHDMRVDDPPPTNEAEEDAGDDFGMTSLILEFWH